MESDAQAMRSPHAEPGVGYSVTKPQPLTAMNIQTPLEPSDEAAIDRIDLQNILVPLDFSAMSMKSLRYAIPLARQFGAKLTLLHVVTPPVYSPELPFAYMCEFEGHDAAETRLGEIRDTMIPAGIAVEIEVSHNFAFEGILKVARDCKVDLIVTTTHGRTGLERMLSGSAAENMVRRAPCPVLVVREVEREFVHAPANGAESSLSRVA
jgi:universal stress protein A